MSVYLQGDSIEQDLRSLVALARDDLSWLKTEDDPVHAAYVDGTQAGEASIAAAIEDIIAKWSQ